MNESVKQTIEQDIKNNKVMLYMKGSPDAPQCGFSAQVIQILNQVGAPFETKDVLSDEGLRQGIKEFADWPTIPQLYVKGEFVGGCDVVTEMAQSGDLEKLIKS